MPQTDSPHRNSYKTGLFLFGGKVREALELLSEKGKGRVLLPDELVPDKDGQTSVMSLLKSKHPQARPLNATAVDLNSDRP